MTNWSKLRIFLGFGLTLGVLFLLFGNGHIDIAVENVIFQEEHGGFVLRHAPWAMMVYHSSKIVMAGIGLLFIFWAVKAWRSPRSPFSGKDFLIGLLGMIAILGSIDAIKRLFGIECPWSIDLFGGALPYHPLDTELPRCFLNHECGGRCFPAGHAMAGFYLVAWAMAFWNCYRRFAYTILIIGIVSGFLLGSFRMIQGAHFFSHMFFSCWLALFLAYLVRVIVMSWPSNTKKDS